MSGFAGGLGVWVEWLRGCYADPCPAFPPLTPPSLPRYAPPCAPCRTSHFVDARSEYYGTISVGTPATDFDVIMDTGSADLIIATTGCSGCDTETTTYSSSNSSTSSTSTTAFSITYGSGTASGVLDTDTVAIAGYSHTYAAPSLPYPAPPRPRPRPLPSRAWRAAPFANTDPFRSAPLSVSAHSAQTFAACNDMNGILDGSIDGLLGLGWKVSSAERFRFPLVPAAES